MTNILLWTVWLVGGIISLVFLIYSFFMIRAWLSSKPLSKMNIKMWESHKEDVLHFRSEISSQKEFIFNSVIVILIFGYWYEFSITLEERKLWQLLLGLVTTCSSIVYMYLSALLKFSK